MTEAEWLGSTNPEAMVDSLRGRATDRKLRLFACACCRDIWAHLAEEVSRGAVAVAEAFADGQTGREGLRAAKRAAGGFTDFQGAWVAAYVTAGHEAWTAAHDVLQYAAGAGDPRGELPSRAERRAARGRFAHLLRELVGNPFRPGSAAPAWLTWNGGTVPRLAGVIYEERRFEQLPILADALEEAGCTDATILAHLRGTGPHVRGCWVVDLLLGKE